jgi:hypothetical protein
MGAGDREIEYVERWVRDADGNLVLRQVQQASDGNVPGLIGQRSYRCVKCGLAFKEKDVQFFRGKPYGIPCSDYKDIQSILRKERADRVRRRRERK